MIYTIRHVTTYRYESAVGISRCVMRLTPATTPWQRVLEHQILLTPKPSETDWRRGPFGAATLTALIDTPHETLVIDARAKVDLDAPIIDSWDDSPPWETVRQLSFNSPGLGEDSPAPYLYPTARTPLTSEITEYARVSFPPGRPIISAVVDLMQRMHADFTFDPKSTDVDTPPAKAFAGRRGVCQDFAHVMICGLRGLGLPAAYMSGYLRTTPPPGRPRLAGADAMHAWVSVWCGLERDWVSVDPTNALIVRNDHIVLARGRDYADVAPIDGVLLGTGEQELKTEVDVIPEGEPAAATTAR